MYVQKTIIGLGSGRCGTLSLSILLNAQIESSITHEGFIPLPWDISPYHYEYYLKYIKGLRLLGTVGDVAFYHLNYINWYVNDLKNIKFICLKRNKQDTVNSLVRLSDKFNINHWTDKSSIHWDNTKWAINDEDSLKFRNSFPKFDLSKKDSISEFYDEYYRRAEYFEQQLPGIFKIFDMEYVLNNIDGQQDLFDFLEIPNCIMMPQLKFSKVENKSNIIK